MSYREKVLLYIAGVGLIGFGANGLVQEIWGDLSGQVGGRVTGVAIFVSIMAVGGLSFAAARVGYRGGAPTAIGLGMIVVGAGRFGTLIDELMADTTQGVMVTAVSSVILTVAALFLLRSGHQLHQYRSNEKLDRSKAEPADEPNADTAPRRLS